ncbi:unnamed protein product [Lactuca virosa]|uniref:Uncharacterized protein n=1 Tax=Lactuca virosa TaxID=75947 RepID=A0AAU9LNR7_9ASTR|nr:unnamed protein product [Lactuca virosa]
MNPSSSSSPWSLSGSFPNHHHHRGSPRPASYAAVGRRKLAYLWSASTDCKKRWLEDSPSSVVGTNSVN